MICIIIPSATAVKTTAGIQNKCEGGGGKLVWVLKM
jgi:hypothetical protein